MRVLLLLALLLVLAAAGPVPKPAPGAARRPAVPDVAAIPGCGAGLRPGRPPAGGHDRPLPFGCATALNLEAMLARPEDLVAPADVPPATGDAAVRPVEAWRRGATASPPRVPGTAGATEAPQ